MDLYTSIGFSKPALTAVGGLFMVIGFAAYHAISRSIFALLLCLYAGGYEGYLMISGTIQNEHGAQVMEVKNDPEVVFLLEKAEKARTEYLSVKERYEDKTSDVYHNAWFKKKHLDPVEAIKDQAHSKFVAKKSAIAEDLSVDNVTWLKILYRLGLVLLCMIIVHRFFSISFNLRKDSR